MPKSKVQLTAVEFFEHPSTLIMQLPDFSYRQYRDIVLMDLKDPLKKQECLFLLYISCLIFPYNLIFSLR